MFAFLFPIQSRWCDGDRLRAGAHDSAWLYFLGWYHSKPSLLWILITAFVTPKSRLLGNVAWQMLLAVKAIKKFVANQSTRFVSIYVFAHAHSFSCTRTWHLSLFLFYSWWIFVLLSLFAFLSRFPSLDFDIGLNPISSSLTVSHVQWYLKLA